MDYYQIWRSGKVNRMHTMPQLVRENIAEHTWGVHLAVLKFYPEARMEFKDAVTLHDFGEQKPGDIPGHVKWSNPEFRDFIEGLEDQHITEAGFVFPELTETEKILLEVFDRADFIVSCLHEIRLGNVNAMEYFARASGRFLDLVRSLPEKDEDDSRNRTSAAGTLSPEKLAALRLRDELRRITETYLSHVPDLYGAKGVFYGNR